MTSIHLLYILHNEWERSHSEAQHLVRVVTEALAAGSCMKHLHVIYYVVFSILIMHNPEQTSSTSAITVVLPDLPIPLLKLVEETLQVTRSEGC